MIWNLLPYDKDSRRLCYNTFNLALHNICDKYHIGYEEPCMVTLDNIMNYTFKLPDISNPTIIVAYHENFGEKFGEHIRKKCPDAKIILLGTDTIYYGVNDSIRMKPNLVIETIKEQVQLINKKVPAEHFYWTLSQDIIEEITALPDVIRDIGGICLCNNSNDRNGFFYRVMDKLDLNIGWGLNSNDFNKIYQFFKRSCITIGITMSAPGFGDDKARSMKGMRDAIGIAAGAMLIYDDYPDIVDLGIVPIYKYRDPISCAELMREYIDKPTLMKSVLEKQQDWLRQNTMEIQLERILLKHNLL